MPHLTLPISTSGPVVDVVISVSSARREALIAANMPVPQPVPIRALVDTGASGTCIDAGVMRSLQLSPTGAIPIHTPSTGGQPHQANTFDINLTLCHPQLTMTKQNIPVTEAHLAVQGIHGLIGRDVLRSCLFVYDGQGGVFALSF
ncbi:MAG: aspartyl protease family protein [Bryobacterales bacterium]|nr:aspartyl protease family protein [Bryobacterales bacterium]